MQNNKRKPKFKHFMNIRKNLVLAMSLLMSTAALADNVLWYRQPAKEWMEAAPIGNGRLAAMVYGGISEERLALGEISLWSGQPDSTNNELCGRDKLDAMRKCFFEDDPEKGNQLGEQYLKGKGRSFGTHLPMGDLVIDFKYGSSQVANYRRELDMDHSVAAVTFECGGVKYRRECIASYPGNIIAMRVTADKPGAVSGRFSLRLLRNAIISKTDDGLAYVGKVDFPMHGSGGVDFCGCVKVKADGGKVTLADNSVSVDGANALTLYLDIRTDYNDPDYLKTCLQNADRAASAGFDALKAAHVADYESLFGRMDIRLGDAADNTLPTDTRLALAKAGATDPTLDALFFQYGRYMLISSSRPSGMPLCANLQGIWNDNRACNMPWTCDYHLDINIEQNYWAANRVNLADCNAPLFSYIGLLADKGSSTARKMYGSRGWVAHTVCNAWGYTSPGWGVGWGMNVTGGAWLATQLWSHYLYTQDRDWLAREGYPLIKRTAEFFVDYMAVDPRTGYLVTGPSVSPENGYVSKKGNHLCLSMMPTIDRAVVYDIYNACIEASRILGVDSKMRNRLEKDIKRLPPLQTASDGQIREWLDDVHRSDPSHRHSSHLLSLFPLGQISYTRTPKLMAAARLGLEKQTASVNWEDTEWSTANMLCFYARLKDAPKAYGWLQNLFKRFTRENLMTVSPAGIAGAGSDIFSFDATEASVAGMCEMLMQSYDGGIEFLPALPQQWADGSVRGLCAEGGLVVDMEWTGGKMKTATVHASANCTFRIKGINAKIAMKKGETRKFDF